ncbi:MAG TPA: malto-oligosyltrehalose synthase, partial [Niastella sp.]|nr:malto-oligosyltrehalose synthase [Niastella sp.]
MKLPLSTYRLQLNASFTFKHVAEQIAYLNELGISTIYASPLFAASAGSMHGYDISDPKKLNKEIGSLEQLQQIASALRDNNMTWLQDIVPNHMVFSMANPRLYDVFERDAFSQYYNWFDIDWQHPDPELHGRIMVPVLGKQLNECIQQKEITLGFGEGGFEIKYLEHTFPCSVGAYDVLLSVMENDPAFAPVSDVLYKLHSAAVSDRSLISWQEAKLFLLKPFMLIDKNMSLVKQLLLEVNSDEQLLQSVAQQQYYQLSWWQNANQKINYRRFFAVNELVALNIDDEDVFNEYHSLLLDLYEENIIQGLRLDHIDGLREPGEYIRSLRKMFGEDCYMIVEKILEKGETLPLNWPMQGTTGYEFGSQVSWLLTNPAGAKEMVDYYRSLFPDLPAYKEIVFEKKQTFLKKFMGGEWDNLVRNLYDWQLVPAAMDSNMVKQALALFMCCFPIYRLYPEDGVVDEQAKLVVQETYEDALRRAPELVEPLTYLRAAVWDTDDQNDTINSHRLGFQKRLMQFTGPLTAKGVEDTTFYVYNALLAHNEVGDTPDMDEYSVHYFHEWVVQRQHYFPHSLNATSTHDSKRGEDGRIRLNVLTGFVNEWKQQVEHWRQINSKFIITAIGTQAPALHDEYFIYQSLIAGFPADGQVTAEFITRFKDYFIKSAREAKLYTDWQEPDSAYEEACCRYIEQILSAEHDFLQSFLPFFNTILHYAHALSLSQALIKFTAPGVPDTYQGCELWNTSYVDPDNRRPVDFNLPKEYLRELKAAEKQGVPALYSYINCEKQTGRDKLFVTWKALQCRRNKPDVFLHGDYIPVFASEECGIIAFARQHNNQWVLVIAPIS